MLSAGAPEIAPKAYRAADDCSAVDEAALGRLLAALTATPPARILWVMHNQADPDSLGAAHALAQAFGGDVAAPDGLQPVARRLAAHLGREVDEWAHPNHYDLHVAVDTSSRAQLGRLAADIPAPMLVDHHRYGDLQEHMAGGALDPARASCAEVALAVIAKVGKRPDALAAFGLLCGLISDTARFRFADAHALDTARQLVAAADSSLEMCYRFLDGDEADRDDPGADVDRRLACLRAAQRVEVARVGDLLIAHSHVGSHDAGAAVALVRAGADLAIVMREKSREARLSMRATPAAQAAGIDLGSLAHAAAQTAGWSGGGHVGAAGLNGRPPAAPVRDDVLARVRAALAAPPPPRKEAT